MVRVRTTDGSEWDIVFEGRLATDVHEYMRVLENLEDSHRIRGVDGVFVEVQSVLGQQPGYVALRNVVAMWEEDLE